MRVEQAIEVPQTYLFALSAAFAEALGARADGNRPRPFSLWPPAFPDGSLPRPNQSGMISLDPETAFTFRITALESSVSERLEQLELRETIKIAGARMRFTERSTETLDPLAFYDAAIADATPAAVRLRFHSPVALMSAGVYLPLPVPILLFRSWLERWDAFEPVKLGDSSGASITRGVAVAPRVIRGTIWGADRIRIPAFFGEADLRLLAGHDRVAAVLFGTLSQYAQYCGSGAKTALGMGATSLVPRAVPKELHAL